MQSSQPRKIGLLATTSMVVGNMVGSGIFLLPASIAAFGGIGILGWVFSSFGAILLALVFGHLSQYCGATIGGPYVYSRTGLGDFAGYLVAWGYWISIWATNAAIAVAFVGYLSVFIPYLSDNPVAGMSVGLGVIWFFTWINSRPITTVGAVQTITTILKVLPIVLIVCFGIFYIRWENFLPFNATGQNTWIVLTSVTTLTLFAFQGMESAGIISGDTQQAGGTVKKATILGTLFTVLVYLTSTVAIMGIVPIETLTNSSAPFADAAEVFWGGAAKYIVAGCAVISTLGALNGWLLLQGRIPMAAAQDKLFPRVFAKENRNGSPIIGIVLSSILASGLMLLNFSKSLVGAYTFIILLSTLATLIPYLFSAVSLSIISHQRNDPKTKSRLWLSLITFVFCIWIIIGCGQEVVFYGFVLLLSGIPFYMLLKRKEQS